MVGGLLRLKRPSGVRGRFGDIVSVGLLQDVGVSNVLGNTKSKT